MRSHRAAMRWGGRAVLLLGCAVLVGAGGAGGRGPRPVAPSVLFTPLDERCASFTADGRSVYFAVKVADGYMQVLCASHLESGRWSEPEVLPFSGRYLDVDPFITPDGIRLYFATNRKVEGGRKRDFDIWVAERSGDGWAGAHPIAGKVNTDESESSPSLARSGRLYFVSSRSGGGDIYCAEPGPDGFGAGVSLGDSVNSPGDERDVAVNPDETLLVFDSSDYPQEIQAPGVNYQRGDLYLSRRVNGVWQRGGHLGGGVNTMATETAPCFSPDGSRLIFTSERGFAAEQRVRLTTDALRRGIASPLNGRGNVWEIETSALQVDR